MTGPWDGARRDHPGHSVAGDPYVGVMRQGFLPPPSADGDGRGRRRVWPPLLGLLILAAGVVAISRFGAGSSPSEYPKHWDRRLQAAVRFVEQDRGLRFKHPVRVEFLSVKEFTKRVTPRSNGDDNTWGAPDGLDADLEALGLVPSDVNFGKAREQLSSASVLGFYDFASQHIVVRGSSLSLEATVTVVHELTHALQDQYYDIGHRGALLAPQTRNARPSGAEDAFRAVVEGDARRVEDDYVHSLPADQQAALRRAAEAERTAARSAIKDVPQTIVALDEAPYDLGRALVDYERQSSGATAETALFRRWPSSDMEILQPWRYVARDLPVRVARPESPSGVQAFDEGTFGALDWYLVLAERLGPAPALAAIDGWAGDSFVAYREREEPCVRATMRATSPAALARLHQAFRAWARTVGALRPAVSVTSTTLRLQSCAPEAGLRLAVPNRTGAALVYATDRNDLATALLRDGSAPTAAVCVASRLMQDLPVSAIATAKPTPRTRRIVRQAHAACGRRAGGH